MIKHFGSRAGSKAPSAAHCCRPDRSSRCSAVPCSSSTPFMSSVEELDGVRADILEAIDASLDHCLTQTSLQGYGDATVGKVRDTYDTGSHLLIVTTDRQSAFDRLLASVPFKGQVLNQTAAWWFTETQDLFPNALVATPDPCMAIMRKCTVFPVEFVVRGYMTGSTNTSLWTHYKQGEREYCGNLFPDGMSKNQRLQENVVTPTTKSADGDVPITPKQIVAQGLMSQEEWDTVSAAALKIFEFGQQTARQRGLILVDTKYEFGVDTSGTLRLLDEVHTPDSSRYWLADTYEELIAAGREPQSIDKEFLRLWFRDNCDPYGADPLPPAPPHLVAELSKRYIHLFERITGVPFMLPPLREDPNERLQRNLDEWLALGGRL